MVLHLFVIYGNAQVLYSASDHKWKIADFGTAAEKSSLGNPKMTLGRRGTGGYRAPELFDDHPTYTTQSDIWGLGCILHELVTFQLAFHEDWNVRDYAWGDRPPVFPLLDFDPHTHTFLASIIKAMLSPEPSKRSSAGLIRRLGTEEVRIASFWARKHSPLTAVRRFMVDPRQGSELNLPKVDELARIGSFRNECFSFSMEVVTASVRTVGLMRSALSTSRTLRELIRTIRETTKETIPAEQDL